MTNRVHTKTVSFSGTTSGVLRMMSDHTLLYVRVPAGFTDCTLTFESSMADTQTADGSITDWAAVFTASGEEYSVTVDADAGEARLFLLGVNVPGNFVRMISSASQTLDVVCGYRGIA